MYDEKLPLPRLEPETPTRMERTLTTIPTTFLRWKSNLSWWSITMTLGLLDIQAMAVGEAEISASGSFQISNQYWGNNLYGLRSEIINFLPAANNSLKRNPLLLIKLPWIEWSLWRIQNAIFTLTRASRCKLWTNKPLETSGIKLKFVSENVYDNKPKLQTTKTVVCSLCGGETAASQKRIKMSNSNNSQQITVPTMQK